MSSLLRQNKIAVVVLVIIAVALFFGGRALGYNSGYAEAQADIQSLQDEAARQAVEEAAKEANPFQTVNPLEGVEANPFDKVKKVLNPFES